MKVVVFSHKDIWADADAPLGYMTDGGFPFQMKAISQLFDQTTLVLPIAPTAKPTGLIPLQGHNIKMQPLTQLRGRGWRRKVRIPFWIIANSRSIWRAFRHADAVHAAIPGDVGTVGMLLAKVFRKPLFVRYCGNWLVSRTAMERFWKGCMRGLNKPHQVMLATGSQTEPPTASAPHINWIFATSLDQAQMRELGATVKTHPGTAPRIIIVGRQEKEKGTGILIECLPELLKTYPQLHLDIIGSGGGLPEFKQLVARLKLESHTKFWGKLSHPQVIECLGQAHLFCFPTYSSEGFPKVVLEALACGLPVVTTKVSALPMLIGQGGGALMAQATTPSCLITIQEVLQDADVYHRLSREALAVAKQYSLEAWRDQIGTQLKRAWGPLQS